ncbi:hypothetical protein TIFTF001_035532 [Ficus carica]|uniref:Transposase (putative) gypsy type domain-containing protein n=1 Tax=Ficus carica TaxID=3494 RepID=A0AA88EAX4_FICCA|nr:hypothetical protein TIFTF001_035511 [Ficus carica]GMN66449.1 hypothetical protein TIFTF001_035514 [Ficus carica]GMN66464.1 hypothetical protein TIFTF001_035529 [Ficus carica]GMN66467.1 hypothetical protein TIFTF001_035532 [Ficus carica]
MDKKKQVIEDMDVEWTSTDSSDNSSDDDELASTIHILSFEHEFQHSRTGAGTSNEASERRRPATTSGAEVLSIPPIARLTKPPRCLSVESFFRMSNPRSVLTEEDLSDIKGRFGFPNKVQLRLPFKNERADTVSEGWICMYTIYFECGLRLPLPPLLVQCMHHYQLAIPQLMPNGMRVFLGLIVLADEAGVELLVDDILAIYYPQENSKDHGRYSMYPRRKKQVVGEMKNADRYWQDHYFFMHVNEKSMGVLANAFYPLWGTLRNKELKKPPPKALLFEEKLEHLLALPNKECDEIHDPKRLRAGALRRLFGTPLFIEALLDEEALIAEFALDTMVMEFPNPKDLLAKRKAAKEAERAAADAAAAASENAAKGNEPAPFPILESSPEPSVKPVSPLAKKRKAVEKGKRKVSAKRNKKSKVTTPELDVKGPKVEVDLPPRVRLLQDKQTSVDIMRQLLSEADADTLNQGPLQSHLDDLLWDGLKILDAFEKATLKARYDFLKEYKQGLFVEAEVDEEIELYEESPDEAGCSSAAPAE